MRYLKISFDRIFCCRSTFDTKIFADEVAVTLLNDQLALTGQSRRQPQCQKSRKYT